MCSTPMAALTLPKITGAFSHLCVVSLIDWYREPEEDAQNETGFSLVLSCVPTDSTIKEQNP